MKDLLLKHFEVNFYEQNIALKVIPTWRSNRTLFFVDPAKQTVRFKSNTYLLSDINFRKEKFSSKIMIIKKDGNKNLGKISHLLEVYLNPLSILPTFIFYITTQAIFPTIFLYFFIRFLLDLLLSRALATNIRDFGIEVS